MVESGGVMNTLSWVGRLFFRFGGVISITLIVVIITSLGGLIESIEQGNILPFVSKVGTRILNYDAILYNSAEKISVDGGLLVETTGESITLKDRLSHLWNIVKSLFTALAGFWYLWFFFVMFFKIAPYFTNNQSASLSNGIFAIVALLILQIFANFALYDEEVWEGREVSLEEKMTPFKGTVSFMKVLPKVFVPIYQVADAVERMDINTDPVGVGVP